MECKIVVPSWFKKTKKEVIGYESQKRIFDLLLVTFLLPLAVPVAFIITIYILIVAGWPIIFVQKRVGKNIKLFKLYKFRTMVKGADKAGLWTNINDGRVIKGCRWLRGSRLDEIPQLWNVIKGDMSLIGPRPVSFYTGRENLASYEIRPGITGLAQVYKMQRADKETQLVNSNKINKLYFENFSWYNELFIILLTIKVMLSLKGI